MLGANKSGFFGFPDANRSTNSWQVEENADKFGNRDSVAVAYEQQGFENIPIAEPHTFGDTFYPSYFLGMRSDEYGMKEGENSHQISFDLKDLVLSTGK